MDVSQENYSRRAKSAASLTGLHGWFAYAVLYLKACSSAELHRFLRWNGVPCCDPQQVCVNLRVVSWCGFC